jgi:hypothetical protein
LYPLISWQDALDLLTPLVLIPLYWCLFVHPAHGEARRSEEIAFIVLGALWVLGHGMHLAANSIDNLVENLAKSGQLDITGTEVYTLTYFLDENLSHYLWHAGVLGLAALLAWRALRSAAGVPASWGIILPAGILHGFSLFAIINEGQTVPLGFPFAILFTVILLICGRGKFSQQPVLAFLFLSFLVATLLFTGWGLYWGGFPEFSDVGLI